MINKIKKFIKTKTAVFINITIIVFCVTVLSLMSQFVVDNKGVEELTFVNDTETAEEKVDGYRYNSNHRHKSSNIPEGLMLNLASALKTEHCWWYGTERCVETAIENELEFLCLSIRSNNVTVDNTSIFDVYKHNSTENAKEWYNCLFEESLLEWITLNDTCCIVYPEAPYAQGKLLVLKDEYVIECTFQNLEDFNKYIPTFENILNLDII